MINHSAISNHDLRERIGQHKINLGGNLKLKIYGTLQCPSGKRMKRENRVFFLSKDEAKKAGYRPCGNCLRNEYMKWAYSIIK